MLNLFIGISSYKTIKNNDDMTSWGINPSPQHMTFPNISCHVLKIYP